MDRACSEVMAVKTGERWEQVRVEVRTGFWKGFETGLGKAGQKRGRNSGLVRIVGRRGEQGLDVRGRSKGGNKGEALRVRARSENWKMGATKGGDQSRIGTREDSTQDLSWDPVPPLKLRALTSLSAGPRPGIGGVWGR